MDEDRVSWGSSRGVRKSLPSEDTFVLESPRDRATSVDYRRDDQFKDLEGTPVQQTEMARVQREFRERRSELALAVTKYLTKVPEIMSLPAAPLLANYSASEIAAYEDMYRHLDTELKNILRTHSSDASFPSFDAFLEGGQVNNASRDLRRSIDRNVHLDVRLHREVSGLLELYAAFAENIGNAKYLQRTRQEIDSHPLA